jgi:hypothetical protein
MIAGRPVGDDVSAAGRSARAIHERVMQDHRQRLENRRPMLIAVSGAAVVLAAAAVVLGLPLVGLTIAVMVLAVVVELLAPPRRAWSWAVGAGGEVLTALALEQLKTEGFVILHDRRIPGSSANIDHIVIGPPGVSIVETKSFRGKLKVRGGDVYVGGYRRTASTVEEARREALTVQVALGDELERRRLRVRPFLCVHRAELPFFDASPQGVLIVDGRGLVKSLRKAPPRLAPDDVRVLAGLVNDRFRPASTPMPVLYNSLPPSSLEPSAGAPQRAPVVAGLEERYQPPVRRVQIQLAREARARATDNRVYWTRAGLTQGKAPPTLPPGESDGPR